MTTKLLNTILEQDQAKLAAHYNGEDERQASRRWVVTALKAELTEREHDAAITAIKECGSLFRGREHAEREGFSMYRCPDTGMLTSRAEQSRLREVEAVSALWALQHGVQARCSITRAIDIVEWVVGMSTMLEVARWLGFQRVTGKPPRIVVDTRPVVPTVTLVLGAMADYYEACGRGGMDNQEQISDDLQSCYSRAQV